MRILSTMLDLVCSVPYRPSESKPIRNSRGITNLLSPHDASIQKTPHALVAELDRLLEERDKTF